MILDEKMHFSHLDGSAHRWTSMTYCQGRARSWKSSKFSIWLVIGDVRRVLSIFSAFFQEKSKDTVTVAMEVPGNMTCRFERRLMFFMRNYSHSIKRYHIPSGFGNGVMPFTMYIVENVSCFGQLIEGLKKSAGPIEKIELYKFLNEERAVLNLLDGLQFEMVDFTIDDFTDESAWVPSVFFSIYFSFYSSAILNIVKIHDIKRLSLTVGHPLISKPGERML